jgi:hypothetical protein
MSELSVPLDYEQLPELWRLRRILGARGTHPSENSPKQIEAAANFLFHRLFVTPEAEPPGRLALVELYSQLKLSAADEKMFFEKRGLAAATCRRLGFVSSSTDSTTRRRGNA